MTHCGWNSVIEALGLGRVLILFLGASSDLRLVARLLEDKRAGLEVLRDNRDGSFTGDSVSELIRQFMVEEKDEQLRKKMSRYITDISRIGSERHDITINRQYNGKNDQKKMKIVDISVNQCGTPSKFSFFCVVEGIQTPNKSIQPPRHACFLLNSLHLKYIFKVIM